MSDKVEQNYVYNSFIHEMSFMKDNMKTGNKSLIIIIPDFKEPSYRVLK
jgi:hypothetical protein